MKRRILFILLILVLLVISTGAAAAQNSYSLWFGKYWSNPDLSGNPAASKSTGVIDFDWGSGPPLTGMPSDHWSAQWTSYVDFSPGTWRITTENDDGVRVFLKDKHVIYDWNKHPPVINQVTVSLLGGTYSMAVDYFEDVGGAKLKMSWERIGPPKEGAADVTVIAAQTTPPPTAPPPTGAWSASYWNNTSLSGNPVLTRSESAINNDWGVGSPAAGIVNPDFFSARWSQSISFPAGTYRFITESDDGIRVFINGYLIIDNWTAHAVTTNSADVALNAGTYSFVVEYIEETHDAVAKFWWETISGGGGTVTGTTATTTAYWLNFRTGPGTSYSKLGVLPRGTVVPIVGRTADSGWIQVVHSGTTGWISTYYTKVQGDLSAVPVTG